MKLDPRLCLAAVLCILAAASPRACGGEVAAPLPEAVKAVWDLGKAYRETTPTRERICINGLWQWQPAGNPHPNPLPKGGLQQNSWVRTGVVSSGDVRFLRHGRANE